MSRLHACIARVRADLDLLEAELTAIEGGAVEWYTSATYPHGARCFRRHVATGMPAIRVGREYRVRREDAESWWASHRVKPVVKAAPADRYARAGIVLRRAS